MTAEGATELQSTATLRRRLSIVVHLAASAGQFSEKLSDAVGRTTDAEIRVMSDLVDRGLTIPALVNLLQGAHLMVGDDSRYEAWIFPTSRRRLSSHHRNIDKRSTPDYGIDGPLVRESLHGKATIGTWVQFERTRATFHWGQLPTWDDVLHLRDFVIYRLTGKNVGPWGLSANVDTRPILLRAPHRTSGHAAIRGLAALSEHPAHAAAPVGAGSLAPQAPWLRTVSPHVPAVGPLGDLYLAPRAEHPTQLLPDQPWSGELGEGLFGSLAVLRASATLTADVTALLETTTRPSLVSLDDSNGTGRVLLRLRGFPIPTRSVLETGGLVTTVASPDQEPAVTPRPDREAPAAHADAAAHPAAGDAGAGATDAGAPDADAADVTLVPTDPTAADELRTQLLEFAELVATGPVRLGAYTQAELALVLGDAPALRGSSPEVLAEAARSLAARGVLFRDPDSDQVIVVGDLGLVVALAAARIGTLEIRRGHSVDDPQEPWRWLITVLPMGVVAIDRVDTLGLHRLAVHSTQGVAQAAADRLLDGAARIPRDEPPAIIDADEARELLHSGLTHWQLLLRLPQDDRSVLTIEAHVVRTSDHRVDLLTRRPVDDDETSDQETGNPGTGNPGTGNPESGDPGTGNPEDGDHEDGDEVAGERYTRTAVDAKSLRQFLVQLFATTLRS